MEDAVSVYEHDNIAVYNATDDVCTISANGDDENAYAIMSGAKEVFSNSERLFGCLEVITAGVGTVYIYGVK